MGSIVTLVPEQVVPEMCILGLTILTQIIVDTIQTMVPYSPNRLLVTLVTGYPSMHKAILMRLILRISLVSGAEYHLCDGIQ